MNTNFQMLKELLEKYHPQTRGVVLPDEFKLIRGTLHLKEMDVLALRNLRDFTVMFLGKSDTLKNWDRMSAIAYTIDTEIINKGGEV